MDDAGARLLPSGALKHVLEVGFGVDGLALQTSTQARPRRATFLVINNTDVALYGERDQYSETLQYHRLLASSSRFRKLQAVNMDRRSLSIVHF
jgi:hypothetical protein